MASLLSLLGIGFISLANALPHEHAPSTQLPPAPTIRWSNCSSSDPPGIECGYFKVPLNYRRPHAEMIDLVAVRLRSSGSARLGTLYYNPGGPGVPASDYIFGQTQGMPNYGDSTLQNYDIVGLDPRGVGLSQPVRCDPNIWNERVTSFPSTEAEFEVLVSHNERLGQSCANLTGPLVNHLDTENVVRDLELLRRAINPDQKLNFLGRSYGSQVGLTYAEFYPGTVGRMALDGIVDHTQDETHTVNDEATAFESTLNQFFIWCNTTSACALQNQDAESIWRQLQETASADPIPAPACLSTGNAACRSDVNAEEIRTAVQNLLLFQNAAAEFVGWDFLSEGLAQAFFDRNASLLSAPLATADTFFNYPGLVIGCQDWRHAARSLPDLRYKISLLGATAPLTRGSTQGYYYQSNCVGWPAPTSNGQRRLRKSVDKAPAMLLVNALFDPSTSIVWATEMQRVVRNAVLLTRVGNGHTSYQLRGEAAEAIDRFLVEGVLPKPASLVYS